MSTALRVAVFGAGGRIAGDYLAVLGELDELSVVAGVEVDAQARERLAAAGMPVFASADALLEGRGPAFDAALLLTPPDSHEPLSVRLLERGHAVLCEKPLAPSVTAVRRMLAAAQAHGTLLAMASKFRFVADVDRARALLGAGSIGTPLLYENVFCSRVAMAGRWNAEPRIAGGGVLVDNGAHAADLARSLGGEVVAVTAAAAPPRVQDLPVEDSVRVTIESVTGVVGHVDLSWSLQTGRDDYVTVHGTDGSLSLCWDGLRLRRNDGGVEEHGDGYDKRGAFRAQLRHFAAAVRGVEPLRPDHDDALHSVAFIEAAYRAMRERRRVAIAEVCG